MKATTETTVEISRVQRLSINVDIVGTAPLIMENWLAKSLVQLEETQTKKAKKAREARDPEAEFREHVYRLPDGRPGMPATAFKSAIVGSARLFGKEVSLVSLKTTVMVMGFGPDQLVPLRCSDPVMWRNPVRNADGGTTLRYRPKFEEWAATLTVQFASPVWSDAQILTFVDAAGMQGVGGWRPSSPKNLGGTYGTFQVVTD